MTTDFTLPNFGDAAFPKQSRLFSSDLNIINQAAGGEGNISGGAVTPSAGLVLSVSAGTCMIGDPPAQVTIGSGTVTVTAAHGTFDRFDLVVINSSAVKSVVAGTAAADPVPPAVPANSVALAQVYVPAGDTTIAANQINGRRINVPPPPPATGALWATVSKAADESTTADTTLSNDAALLFSMNASTKYRGRMMVFIESPTAADFKWDITGPASPTIVTMMWGWGVAGGTPTWDGMSTAYPSDSIDHASGTAAVLFIDFIIHNGANAGTFNFRWAQNTSNGGSTIVRAGSYLEYAVA